MDFVFFRNLTCWWVPVQIFQGDSCFFRDMGVARSSCHHACGMQRIDSSYISSCYLGFCTVSFHCPIVQLFVFVVSRTKWVGCELRWAHTHNIPGRVHALAWHLVSFQCARLRSCQKENVHHSWSSYGLLIRTCFLTGAMQLMWLRSTISAPSKVRTFVVCVCTTLAMFAHRQC